MRIGTYNVLGLSGYPPQEAGQILGNPTSEQTAAHFQEDRLIWIVDVHLHPGRIELRNEEADIVENRIATLLNSGHPVVVLGDFNCEIGERTHQVLSDAGFANAMATVGGGIRPTIDTAGIEGQKKIDHIYVSSSLAGRLTHAEVVRREGFRQDEPLLPGQWVHSDHLPVVATLDYP